MWDERLDHALVDVVVSDASHARSRLQSADIALHGFADRANGWRWTATTLERYPGCLVAVAYDVRRRWCLHHVRGVGKATILALRGSLDRDVLYALALMFYQDALSGRRERNWLHNRVFTVYSTLVQLVYGDETEECGDD